MSIGSFGGIQGSAAGAPLSQSQGSETEKTRQQAAASERKAEATDKSEKASGIGTTEEDQQASDRDADGRRMYEDNAEQPPTGQQSAEPATTGEPPKSKDPSGLAGGQLDLLG